LHQINFISTNIITRISNPNYNDLWIQWNELAYTALFNVFTSWRLGQLPLSTHPSSIDSSSELGGDLRQVLRSGCFCRIDWKSTGGWGISGWSGEFWFSQASRILKISSAMKLSRVEIHFKLIPNLSSINSIQKKCPRARRSSCFWLQACVSNPSYCTCVVTPS
jgi:hypothetical protein